MRINYQLLLTHGLLVILSLIIVAINIVTYERISNDATIINHSGKLRALSYNMSLLSNRLHSQELPIEQMEIRETLSLRMNEFDNILLTLSEKPDNGINHKPTMIRFDKIKNEWNEIFKPLYQDILESKKMEKSNIQINKKIDSFVSMINEMVTSYSEYASGKVLIAVFTNGLLIFVIIMVTVYSFASTNKRIRKPMNRLMKELKELSLLDEDELSEELKRIKTNEISQMSQYFNVMIYDQLTRAFNRRAGLAKLSRLMQSKERDFVASLCFIDINGLKEVNDYLGHKYGDELIVSAVERIKQEIREEDFVIRMGGDEFLIIMKGIGASLSEKVWDRINNEYKMINEQEGRLYNISVSHGIVEYSNWEVLDLEALIKIADDKMYAEKKQLKSELKVQIIRKENI